jgi:hypothetical protein
MARKTKFFTKIFGLSQAINRLRALAIRELDLSGLEGEKE